METTAANVNHNPPGIVSRFSGCEKPALYRDVLQAINIAMSDFKDRFRAAAAQRATSVPVRVKNALCKDQCIPLCLLHACRAKSRYGP